MSLPQWAVCVLREPVLRRSKERFREARISVAPFLAGALTIATPRGLTRLPVPGPGASGGRLRDQC